MRPALSVASECAPLVKTGGLADVVGALPGALKPEGWALRVLIPGYRAVLAALPDAKRCWSADDFFGGPARILAGKAHGLDLLVLDAPHLYDRDGSLYVDAQGRDWPDNPERFAALSDAAARIAADGLDGWRPELLHLHDWQAGLAAVYLRERTRDDEARPGVITTIHNIAFHGIAPGHKLGALALPASGFTSDGFEYYGHIGALKAGLVYADKITTVSPTYARELTTSEFGMGLDGVIRARGGDVTGILNGVDEEAWNPATDPAISAYKTPRGKARNKRRLEQAFELPQSDSPLCVVVSRLSGQKGLDMLLQALPALTARGGRLALLGSGDRALEHAWLRAAEHEPNVAVRIGYDEALSHLMYAGGDAVLVPSRFEPCGLTQLYGLRYGAIPLVALTGGLADTIINANDAALKAGAATGLQFHPVNAHALAGALGQLCDLYQDKPQWAKLQRNAMRHDVGWSASAPHYAALYDAVAG